MGLRIGNEEKYMMGSSPIMLALSLRLLAMVTGGDVSRQITSLHNVFGEKEKGGLHEKL